MSLGLRKRYGQGSLECSNCHPMLHFGPKLGLGRQGPAGTGRWQRGERGERTHMPTTCPLTRLGLQVSKVLKRGDPAGGEAANSRPLLFLVPGRHYKRVHLLPKYRTREAQHTPGAPSQPLPCQERAGYTMKSYCPMAEATECTGAKTAVTDQKRASCPSQAQGMGTCPPLAPGSEAERDGTHQGAH